MNIKKIVKSVLGSVFYLGLYKYIKPKGNRVLIYHAFGSKLTHDTYGISIQLDLFKRHIEFLSDTYKMIEVEKISEYANCNTVSISIDDGYKDNMLAANIMDEVGIPYVIYISTGMIGNPGYLNEEDIRKLNKSKFCTIGSHTVNHVHLTDVSYQDKKSEIVNSKNRLQKILGEEIKHFSYPYGSYDKDCEDIANKTYKYVATSHVGINTTKGSSFKIKRTEVIASDDTHELMRKVEGFYDYLGFR